jgi:hypothetical protein
MATIADNLQTIKDSTEAIRQAIISKGGTISGGLTTYADAIRNITDGETSQEPDMPIIGDGKTYLYISVTNTLQVQVPLYFNQTVSNGVTIDWGDGITRTISGTGNVNTTHNYNEIGDYVISLSPKSGCTLRLGSTSSGTCVMGSTAETNKIYRSYLKKVELGTVGNLLLARTFSECSSLSAIYIPNGITEVKTSVFYNCISLLSITLPDSVTSISDYAFYNCVSLQNIIIPDSVTGIGNNAFTNCYSLQNVTLPSSITTISNYAFYKCYTLKNITMPSSVISLGNRAFMYCTCLPNIQLPNNLTSIGSESFSECHSLTSIVVPPSVTSIGDKAFYNCKWLHIYDFSNHTGVPSLGTDVFTGIPEGSKIIVPTGWYYSWKSATNWSTYTGYIIRKEFWDNGVSEGGSSGGGSSD